MLSLKRLVLFCTFFLLNNQSFGSVIEHPVTYIEYIVKPTEGQSLQEATDAASSIREDGKVFHGITNWGVAWHFEWHMENNISCKIFKTTTEVTSEITLPKLVSQDKNLQKKFAAYVAALRSHEQGHVRNGVNAAYAIDEVLSELPEMKNCQILSNSANEIANKKLKEFKALDKSYDISTQHGKTQGAVLDDK